MPSSKKIATLLLTLAMVGCTGRADLATSTSGPSGGDPVGCPRSGDEIETARLYIEYNAADGDTGVHGIFGGEAWTELCIWSPEGELILHVTPEGRLGDLGVSDLFFESREPTEDEYSIPELMGDFPEGPYLVGATDFEGVARVASASFTHSIPAAPLITSPAVAPDEESASDTPVERSGLEVAWEPVQEDIEGASVSIVSYEVIVTKVEHEDPDANSLPVYDVHVGPDVRSLEIAADFLEPETLYELEVLAIEESGNQTIGLGFFTTNG